VTENKPSDTAIAADKAGGLWGELAPVIAFIVIYNVMLRLPNDTGLFSVDTALYWATGFLIAARWGFCCSQKRLSSTSRL